MPAVVALAQAAGPSSGLLGSSFLIPLAAVFAIWWFLLIRPQSQREKQHRAMLAALKPGDRVLTQGGIYGVVAQLGEGSLKIKIADNVRVEVARSAIVGLGEAGSPPADKKDA